ncbi:hypothetical protein F4225_11520 [Candidatus Poribacteria bacterium]|nr:hypothetical protein [Candidatus Poribacteria bacterium]
MNNRRSYCFICIVLCVLCLNISFAVTIYVPSDQPTIQAGIDAAQDGDTVLVADGTYKGEGNVNIDFLGKEITVKSVDGPKSTIIDCQSTPETRGFNFQNHETNDAVLEGFTIKNGNHVYGSGINCINASPTIKNSIISGNRITSNKFGIGIYAVNSDMVIVDTTISNNWTGVYFEFDDRLIEGEDKDTLNRSTLVNCIVSDNIGTGVVSLHSARTEIRDSEVSKNGGRGVVSNAPGSGIYINNSVISLNGRGGVECSEFAFLKITDSIIRQNTAKEGGGIYGSPSANIEVSNSIISQNIATRRGGGIHVGSTFGSTKISHCTISRNTADGWGGGVYASIEIAFFEMSDSIIWGNSSDTIHDDLFISGGTIEIHRCNIRDGLKHIHQKPEKGWFIYDDNIDTDPLFVDADRGDYRLKSHSPAINMGANAAKQGLLSVSAIGKKVVKWVDLKRR